MRHILGLDLQNVVSFNKLSADFNAGLIYVRGLNLDSDKAAPTGNGVGKSVMFSTMANLFYQTTPLALKKKTKKSLLASKSSCVGMLLRTADTGAEYEILQTATGYKIYEDGVDLRIRTVPLAEEFIRKLFPLSQTEFYSTVYLSTERPYALQRDTDANRLQHLTDIFKLDQYSGIREKLAVKRRAITDNEIKLSVLEQRVLNLNKKLAELSAPVSKKEYLALKAAYEAQTVKLEKVQARSFTLLTTMRDLSALLKIERTLDELRAKYTFKKPPAEMLKLLKKQQSAAEAWDRYQHRKAQSDKLRKATQAKIDALDLPIVPEAVVASYGKQLATRIADNTAKLRELSTVAREYAALDEKLQSLAERISEFSVTPEKDVDYDSEIALLKSTLRLEHLLHDHDEDLSSCPTCMSDLDVDDIKKTVASAKKRLPKLQACATLVRIKSEFDAFSTRQNKLAFNETKLAGVKKALRKDTEEKHVNDVAAEVYKRHNSLAEHLASIASVKKPEREKPEYSVVELAEHVELCTSIVDALSSKAVLTENGTLSELRSAAAVKDEVRRVEAELAEINAEIAAIRQEQSDAATTISACEHFKSTNTLYRKELAEATAEIAVLAPSVKDKKLLDILLKAYGAKGLRAKAAESVCALLQTNLNHYRDLIFAEPFQFEVSASEAGVSIRVDRNNGKADSASDVRTLSGAESNCFQLLCLISLLPLLPNKDRVNLVILDEPTSHQDEASRAIFNERFIPVLREVVPTIVIITPHPDDASANSSEWLVQKEGGVSTLKVA